MESLGNDNVSSPNACKYLQGNDDVKAENARRRYGYCDVTMTEGAVNEKSPSRVECVFWPLSQAEQLQAVRFPVLAYGFHRAPYYRRYFLI